MREESGARIFFPRWGSLFQPSAVVLLLLLAIWALKALRGQIDHDELQVIAISSVMAWPLVLIGARYLGRVWVTDNGIRCVGRKVILWSEITEVSPFRTPLLAGLYVRSMYKLTVIVHHSIVEDPQFQQSIAEMARGSMLFAFFSEPPT